MDKFAKVKEAVAKAGECWVESCPTCFVEIGKALIAHTSTNGRTTAAAAAATTACSGKAKLSKEAVSAAIGKAAVDAIPEDMFAEEEVGWACH